MLLLGILLWVAAFPAKVRVVILKQKHPQPQSNNQSDGSEKRGNNTPTLVPRSHAGGKQSVDDELEGEDEGEVKQHGEA